MRKRWIKIIKNLMSKSNQKITSINPKWFNRFGQWVFPNLISSAAHQQQYENNNNKPCEKNMTTISKRTHRVQRPEKLNIKHSVKRAFEIPIGCRFTWSKFNWKNKNRFRLQVFKRRPNKYTQLHFGRNVS